MKKKAIIISIRGYQLSNKEKILLANEATKILHGNKSSMKSQKTARDTFELGKASKNLPEIKINYSEVNKGLSILELLSRNNILPSKSEARRAIKNNGIKINDIIISDNFDNTTWIFNSTFVIITKQSGFNLLESSLVTPKNSVNIITKNINVILNYIQNQLNEIGMVQVVIQIIVQNQ